MDDLLKYEKHLWDAGYKDIMGIDEAGRGALSGPLVIAGVIYKKGKIVEGARDSKLLSPAQREELYPKILKTAKKIVLSIVPPFIIDNINIYNATLYGAMKLIEIGNGVDYLLLDAFLLKGVSTPQIKLIKGERKSISIASASIIAKVSRDRIMQKLHKFYPEYRWDMNKGYPTKDHISAISKYGITPFHRKSYGPCKT